MKSSGAVLVFGGTGGIGREVLEVLLERTGHTVLATCRGLPPVDDLPIHWIQFEATREDGGDAIATVVNSRAVHLDAIIFCIGIPSTKRPVVETTTHEWLDLFTTNTIGFVHAYRAVKDAARRSQSRIVIFSSDTTRVLGAGNGPYTASKVALEAIVQTLAKEEAQFGVRFNLLAPSLVDSPLAHRVLERKGVTDQQAYAATLPWGRLLTLREVAGAAVSLALDSHWDYATGNVVRISANK